MLETLDVRARMDSLNRILIKELEVLELGSKIQSQVQSEVGRNQREYFLREQMKAIQKELGEDDDQQKEIEELREKIEAAGMPEAVKKEAVRELERLSRMPVAAAEYTVSRTYLDWLVALPWNEAHRRSDRSAEDQANPRRRSFRPGEGEGSHPRVPGGAEAEPGDEGADPLLRRPSRRRQDVARADRLRTSLGRKFVRVSLGGMRDEAEIRGHRRTYIGALPGQIIQGLRRAESKNPVFILDEIDKLGSDFRGDPARRCSRCSIRSRTTRSAITIWTSRSISPRCCSSRPPTCSIRFRRRSATAWRCSSCRLHRGGEARRSRASTWSTKQVKNHGLTPR